MHTRFDPRNEFVSAWHILALNVFFGVVNSLDAQVIQLLNDGQKIAAIKLVRERKGIGLKEAKEYVERFPSADAPASLVRTLVFWAILVAIGVAIWQLVG